MTLKVRDWNTADEFIGFVPEKSRQIIRNALQGLGENPFPGSGGDKKKLVYGAAG
ncbi:MAG: hypothetical protein WCF90_06215 [Methanomicrobiales archaeon]